MSVSSLSSLAAAFNAQSSSTSATFNSSSSSSASSSGSLTAKQQQQYSALQTISAYQTAIANSLGDLLGASNSKAGASTGVNSIANGLAAVFSESNTPNFNIEFNNIQNSFIDRVNAKTTAYQNLVKSDPNTANLQAQLATQQTQATNIQNKLNQVVSNSQILQSIGYSFGQISTAVGNYAVTAQQVSAQASFNSAISSITHDLALLQPTLTDQYSAGDNLGQLQAAFQKSTVGALALPDGKTFSQLQITDFANGAPVGSQITLGDFVSGPTNPVTGQPLGLGVEGTYNSYNSLQDGVRQALEEQINTANANVAATQAKIAAQQKSDQNVAFSQLTAYKLQVSTILTSISNSFDNQSLLASQLASALNGTTNTRGSVLNLFG